MQVICWKVDEYQNEGLNMRQKPGRRHFRKDSNKAKSRNKIQSVGCLPAFFPTMIHEVVEEHSRADRGLPKHWLENRRMQQLFPDHTQERKHAVLQERRSLGQSLSPKPD